MSRDCTVSGLVCKSRSCVLKQGLKHDYPGAGEVHLRLQQTARP